MPVPPGRVCSWIPFPEAVFRRVRSLPPRLPEVVPLSLICLVMFGWASAGLSSDWEDDPSELFRIHCPESQIEGLEGVQN